MTTKERALKALESLGGAKRVREELLEYTERVERFERKRSQLTEQYPDKWVAMADGEVVAVADSLEDVLTELDECGLRRSDAVVEFLDTHPRNMIL